MRIYGEGGYTVEVELVYPKIIVTANGYETGSVKLSKSEVEDLIEALKEAIR